MTISWVFDGFHLRDFSVGDRDLNLNRAVFIARICPQVRPVFLGCGRGRHGAC